MPRGFVWGAYFDDDGTAWLVRVDADYALEASRGWGVIVPATTSQLPRGWTPRRVWGTDPSGNKRFAVVSRVDADLWTGAVGSFVIEANDNTLVEVEVLGRLREHRLPVSGIEPP